MSVETTSAAPKEVLHDFPRLSVLDQYTVDRQAELTTVKRGLGLEVPITCDYEQAVELIKPVNEDSLGHINGNIERSNGFGELYGTMLGALRSDLKTAFKADNGTKLVMRKNSIIDDQEIRALVTFEGRNPELPEKIVIYPTGAGFEFSLVLTPVSGYTKEIKAVKEQDTLKPGNIITVVKDSIHKGTNADLNFGKQFAAGLIARP